MPVISVHGRLRQEDLKVGASLCFYIVNHSPKCLGWEKSMNAKTNGFLRSDGNLQTQKIITEEKEICGAENSAPTFIKLYHKQCINQTDSICFL